MNEAVYYIWLNAAENLTAAKKCELIEFFSGAQGVYEADDAVLRECEFLSQRDINTLSDKNLRFAQKEYERSLRLGINFVLMGTPQYPPTLLNIPDPPILLYTRGDISLLKKELALCIVGSRHATQYGITAAMQISSQLAQCGMMIVSGCANGIDSAAHKAAMQAGGKTVGVAGCGINVDYPAGNKTLRDEMAQKGLIISEFPLDTPAYSYNFPRRNRIMSGLSLGVAVIEAGHESGALITARHAWEQNKDVFALPGNITNKNSAGVNSLISDGAALIFGADTILSEYIMRFPQLFELEKIVPKEETTIKNDTAKVIHAFERTEDSDDESVIKKLLGKGEMHIDEIADKLSMSASEANAFMTMMQIKGVVREKAGRMYSLK